MSAASTYYSFVQKPSPASGASPQTGQEPHSAVGVARGRQRQTAASPSCSSIATSSSNSSSSLNAFAGGLGGGCNSSMASPVSLASPCSSSVSSSSSSSASSSSSGIPRQRNLMRQASLTPTQGMETSSHQHHSQLFHSCTLHSLEPKPIKPFKSCSEYLEAMKEDLAEWLNRLYPDLDLTPDNLFQYLETGAIICRHANNVTQMGRCSMVDRSESSFNSISNSDIYNSGSRRNSRSQQQRAIDSLNQQQETFTSNYSNDTEPNNNNIVSSRSPSISLSSPNDSLQYQSYSHNSMKSPPSLNNSGSNSLMMMINNNSHSPRQQDQGNGYSNHTKTTNWFQVKMISYKKDVSPGTFHARDNICQFILWCRSLNIRECLLFETDDLVARKNEKSFILCMLEVARIGFKVGMPTPLIIQLEQEIDREIENDAKRQKQLEEEKEKLNQANEATTINNSSCLSADEREDCDNYELNELDSEVYERVDLSGLDGSKIEEKQVEDERKDQEEDEVEEEELDFGPKPQVITNDLLSLHEKVVQLLCLCTCPTQFPMVRVGDNGKYKVGDKLIIFVRILRRHIMVRVGGGWQELSEFLRVKDPCRAKSPPVGYQQQQQQQQHYHNQNQYRGQHQTTTSQIARLVPSSRSRLGESSHHLNKGHQHHHQSYRNNSGQRLISGSASMSWLSHNS